jgi:tellurite resistance protein
MKDREQTDLLRAALALAYADEKLTRSEKGVIDGLAARVGVKGAALQSMIEEARRNDFITDRLYIRSREEAEQAFELLVAQARIDGEISEEERSLLVRIATSLGIRDDDFERVYSAGIARADHLRRSRGMHGAS